LNRFNSRSQFVKFAFPASLGASPLASAIVNVEAGDNPNPTIETIEKIAKALGVSIDELLKK